MADYIKRSNAINALKGLPTWWADQGGIYGNAQPPMEAMLDPEDAVSAIENIPSADVVEVVRCKDCIHRPIMEFDDVMPPLIDEEDYYRDYQCPYVGGDDYYNVMPDDNWFCNHGERKDDGT